MTECIVKYIKDHYVEITGIVAIINVAFPFVRWIIKSCRRSKGDIRYFLILFFSICLSVLILHLNNEYLWSFGMIILANLVVLLNPFFRFTIENERSISRKEIIYYIMIPLLLCIFISATYIPSFVIRTNLKASGNIPIPIETQTKAAK